jgi:biopolymer transport protein ExbB
MQHVIEFLGKGGIVMYPLLLSSVIALAIVIEKSLSMRRKKIIIPEITSILDNIKGPGDIGLAVAICQKHEGPFANIIKSGLENKDLPREEIKEILIDNGKQEVYKIGKGLPLLETIGGIAPLLGLLGTVTGILKVFNVIQMMGMGQAPAMAGGISEALITTIAGLSIGIPSVVAYNYFTSKSESLILEMEKYSSILLSRISSFSKSR